MKRVETSAQAGIVMEKILAKEWVILGLPIREFCDKHMPDSRLSTQLESALFEMGVRYAWHLMTYSEDEIKTARLIGPKSWHLLKSVVSEVFPTIPFGVDWREIRDGSSLTFRR